jgi:Transcriptional regulator
MRQSLALQNSGSALESSARKEANLASHHSVTISCHQLVTEEAVARDRFATRAAILESAAELISAHGVDALGVNVLAEAAGCDKVLIYRYFGGLDGVLETLGAERTVWPRVEVEAAGGPSEEDLSLADTLQAVVLEEWAALAAGAFMLKAESAEVLGENALGRATAVQRRERHAELVTALRAKHRVPPYVDLPALLELLSAGLTLFALRAASGGDAPLRSAEQSASLDPSTEEGWRRIEKTVGMVARSLLDA